MPIFEYRCANCNDLFEVLILNNRQGEKAICPKCNNETSDRVMSSTNFCVTGDSGNTKPGPSSQTRNCSGGSCTTYDIPGPK